MQRPALELQQSEPDHGRNITSSKEAHILSCERCARRKIKCDRSGDGCLNCKKAGVQCHVVARPRLPRGRRNKTTKANSDLKARLMRLENLVSSYAQPSDDSSSLSSNTPPTGIEDDAAPSVAPKGVNKYVGREFWTGLSQEITEVREALEYSEDEEDNTLEAQTSLDAEGVADAGVNRTSKHSFLGISAGLGKPIEPGLTEIPMTSALCEIFLYRFAPVVKVGHGPAFRALMCGQPYLDYPADHLAPKLLTYAICYAACITLKEPESLQRFATDRATLRDKYRNATETYMAKADLLTTLDLTVLEAFVIYINAIRSEDSSRKSWTLTAVALRIAHAMNLQLDDSDMNLRPFHREMRRRLWTQIRMSDIRAAYDRGTSFMISNELSELAAPLNINDADFSFETKEPLHPREGYTDMTHTLITVEGSALSPILTRRVQRFDPRLEAASGHTSTTDENPLSRTYDQDHVIAWFRELEQKYLRFCDGHVDMQWYTKQVATTMAATGLLFAVRPLRTGSVMHGNLSSDSILLLSTDVLEKANIIRTHPQAGAWDWFTFVPWHSLAVAVAELCNRPSGPIVEKAWPIVEAAFAQYSQSVADSDKGMLWRPLAKLLRKAQKTRSAYLESIRTRNSASNAQSPASSTQARTPQAKYLTPAPFAANQIGNIQFDAMDFGDNNLLNPNEADLDWLQSVINMEQPYVSPDTTSNSWDQWTAFVQNMESTPDDALMNYGTQNSDWPNMGTLQNDLPAETSSGPRFFMQGDGFLPPIQM